MLKHFHNFVASHMHHNILILSPTGEALSNETVVGCCGVVVLACGSRLLEGAAPEMPMLTWKRNGEEITSNSEDEVSVELLQEILSL